MTDAESLSSSADPGLKVFTDWIHAGGDVVDLVRKLVSDRDEEVRRAVLAERERCAKIVEPFAGQITLSSEIPGAKDAIGHLQPGGLAAMIRAEPETP